MRDGARLMADVFRPRGPGRVPAILNLGPYQKDKLWVVPPILEEAPNEWMNWETINPRWWVPQGYAAMRVDGRGSGKMPGPVRALVAGGGASTSTMRSNGRRRSPGATASVGLLGISYYAINQWFVAQLQPPSLEGDHPVGRLRRHLPRLRSITAASSTCSCRTGSPRTCCTTRSAARRSNSRTPGQ